MNSVTLVGNIASEPELEPTKDGTARLQLMVLVRRKSPFAHRQSEDLVPVVCFGKRATEYAKTVKLGTRVSVAGWLEERKHFEAGKWIRAVRVNAHVIVADAQPTGIHLNQVSLQGRILKEPVFETTSSGFPFMRLMVRVHRESNQISAAYANRVREDGTLDVSQLNSRERSSLIDDLPVVFHGDLSRVAIRYCALEGQVHVAGWLESRTYYDRKAGRQRRVIELHVTRWVPGPGCNHAAGDAFLASFRSEHPHVSLDDLGIVDDDDLSLPLGVED